jgi:hypothetical protein
MPNAFLGTIIEAYNRHLPLVLSPDDFWLLISIGVSQFISNPKWTEKYRHTFVEHEGKEQLRVEFVRPNLNDTKVWTKFVAEIADEIANRTKSTIAEVSGFYILYSRALNNWLLKLTNLSANTS